MPVRPASRIRARRRACRADFAWFGFFLFAAFVMLDVVVDHWPLLYDPEHGTRLGLLRQRIAEAPERPVLLVVGSSHVGLGFHPELMPPVQTEDGTPVLAFTWSHLAAGPAFKLLQVQRVLREGIRPRWIVVEMGQFTLTGESPSMSATSACAADLPTLLEHFDPCKVGMVYLRGRLNPWYKHRQVLLESFAPALACARQEWDSIRLNPQGGDNFWFCPQSLAPEKVRQLTHQTIADDRDRLQHYQVAPGGDRAMRELLALCRREGIGVAVVMMPESSEYRAAYSPQAERTLAGYVADLERSTGVPVIDARRWVPDEHFSDGTHLFRTGGVLFTRRLADEVLRPLVAGRLAPHR